MEFNLKGLLQDEEFLLGAGLLSAGSQGQSLGQAALPQMLRAANISNAFQEKQRKTDFREAVSKMDQSGFSDIEKALIRFDPIKGYEMVSKNKRAKANRLLTDEEVEKLKLPSGTIVQQDEKGKLNVVSKPSAEDLLISSNKGAAFSNDPSAILNLALNCVSSLLVSFT